MKKVIMLIAAVSISTLAFAGGADVFKNMYMNAFGTNGSQYVYVWAYDSSLYGGLYVDVFGSGFSCNGSSGDLDVKPTAKYGTFSVNTADLSCEGSPPSEVSVECVANGEISSQGVSNGKFTFFGDVFKGHVNYTDNSADCMIYADDVLFDNGYSDGGIRYENRVNK